MKFILALAFAISVLSTQANHWTPKSTFPGSGRQLASGFSIGDKAYVCCGLDTAYNNDLWEYDAVSDAWTQKANMPGLGRFGAVAFSINGKGYIGTGGTSIVFYKDFWEYDPVSNSWVQKANFGGHSRQRAAGFSAAGKGYICCGEDLFNVYDDIWEWNPFTNVWIQKAPIPIGRLGPASFVIDGKAYIISGYNSTYLNDNWQFDPAANSWTQKANFPAHGRTDASSFTICDKGFLGSGGESPYYDDFWQYNPLNDSWTQQTNFPGGRLDDCFYFAVGMKGYVGSGQPLGVGYTRQVWEFTPDSVCAMPVAAHFTSSDTNICNKQCVDFFDLSTNNPTSWQWFFPGSDLPVSNVQNPTQICYQSQGSFTVTLVACNALGCDTIFVPNHINAFIQIPVFITQSNDTLYSSPGTSYQWWSVDSGIINGAANSYFVPVHDGNYFVKVNDSIGCTGTSQVWIVTKIGEGSTLNQSLNIFPNPFNDKLFVKCLHNAPMEISLFDVTSRKIFSKLFISETSIETGIFARGIYLYEIRSKGILINTGKIIKD